MKGIVAIMYEWLLLLSAVLGMFEVVLKFRRWRREEAMLSQHPSSEKALLPPLLSIEEPLSEASSDSPEADDPPPKAQEEESEVSASSHTALERASGDVDLAAFSPRTIDIMKAATERLQKRYESADPNEPTEEKPTRFEYRLAENQFWCYKCGKKVEATFCGEVEHQFYPILSIMFEKFAFFEDGREEVVATFRISDPNQNNKINHNFGGSSGKKYVLSSDSCEEQLFLKIMSFPPANKETYEWEQKAFAREERIASEANKQALQAPRLLLHGNLFFNVEFQDLSFLLFEYIDAINLFHYMNAKKRDQQKFEDEELFFLLLETAFVVKGFHESEVTWTQENSEIPYFYDGIVHSDLKPAQFLCVQRDGKKKLYLVDFGTSGFHQRTTESFDSTEIYRAFDFAKDAENNGGKRHRKKSHDVYSLGVMFYQLLFLDTYSNSQEFRVKKARRAQRVASKEEQITPIKEDLLGCIDKMLEDDESERLTIQEVYAELCRIFGGLAVSTLRTTQTQLEETQTQLEETQMQLEETQTQLQKAEDASYQLQIIQSTLQLNHLQSERARATLLQEIDALQSEANRLQEQNAALEEAHRRDLTELRGQMTSLKETRFRFATGDKMKLAALPDAEVVYIGPGSFESPENWKGGKVTPTRGFFMLSTPVTQEMFLKLMEYNPSFFQEDGNLRRPVECVSWHEAAAFCNKLSELQGLQPVYQIEEQGKDVIATIHPDFAGSRYYNAKGWRLPTEAEWEYACRAGTTGKLLDDLFNDLDDLFNDIAWFRKDGEENVLPIAMNPKNRARETHPVATKEENAWGLDTSENVMEWCYDAYKNDVAANLDPIQATMRTFVVWKGCSWNSCDDMILKALCYGSDIKFHYCKNYDLRLRFKNLGFRLVRSSH